MNICIFNQKMKKIGLEVNQKNMMNLCHLKNQNLKHLKGIIFQKYYFLLDQDKNMHLVPFYKKNLILLKDLEQKDLIQ